MDTLNSCDISKMSAGSDLKTRIKISDHIATAVLRLQKCSTSWGRQSGVCASSTKCGVILQGPQDSRPHAACTNARAKRLQEKVQSMVLVTVRQRDEDFMDQSLENQYGCRCDLQVSHRHSRAAGEAQRSLHQAAWRTHDSFREDHSLVRWDHGGCKCFQKSEHRLRPDVEQHVRNCQGKEPTGGDGLGCGDIRLIQDAPDRFGVLEPHQEKLWQCPSNKSKQNSTS